MKPLDNSIAKLRPDLLDTWDFEKNVSLNPSTLSIGSNKCVWWKCNIGHSWNASPHNRQHSKGCPYCSGIRILQGYNDLFTTNPALADEWDYETNEKINPHTLAPNSNKKVGWICSKGHRWNSVIAARTKGSGCPVCANKVIIPGTNDFATVHPELLSEWNYEKNANIQPWAVAPSGTKKVWWICKNGHEYQATLNKRHNGTGCPYCNSSRLLSGYNDLETVFPEIAKQWDFKKNGVLLPSQITAHNNRSVWWLCDKGHSWRTSVDNRAKKKGCPHCSGRIITAGFNDFKSLYPEIAIEWDYEKNGSLQPTSLGGRSSRNVWWKCQACSHSWNASLSNRVAGTGCPKCARRTHSSFPEQAIFFYIHKAYPDTINGYNNIFENQMELDIFVPSLNLAIEYDGKAWHHGSKNLSKEIAKYTICKSRGISLIRVKESISPDDVQTCDHLIASEYDYSHYKTLEPVLLSLKKYFPLISDTNIERDRNSIRAGYYSLVKQKSLRQCFPSISQQWHEELNGSIKPDMVLSISTDRAWWKCEKGHSWQARISNRVKGSGCPYCSNKKLLVGYNDLSTTHPHLTKQWNYKKNNNLSPDEVLTGSPKKVWWICSKKHEWQANIYSRCSGRGCPFCSGRYAIEGETDLQTLKPEIASDWDIEKNIELLPSQVTTGSGKKAWWKCSYGHELFSSIYERVKSNGCPVCNRQRTKKKGFTD